MTGRPFDPDHFPTPGALMHPFSLTRPSFSGRISLWDTAGTERYHALAPMYYRDSAAAIIVYSVSDRLSFDNVRQWIQRYRADDRQANPVILVANKIDASPWAVTTADGRDFAVREKLPFAETSAKEGIGIEALLDELALALKDCSPPAPSAVRYAPLVKNVICC